MCIEQLEVVMKGCCVFMSISDWTIMAIPLSNMFLCGFAVMLKLLN
jgi:hypothetical protein